MKKLFAILSGVFFIAAILIFFFYRKLVIEVQWIVLITSIVYVFSAAFATTALFLTDAGLTFIARNGQDIEVKKKNGKITQINIKENK